MRNDRRLMDGTGGQKRVRVILEEMGRGNFSFLILVVGVIQIIVMLRRRR